MYAAFLQRMRELYSPGNIKGTFYKFHIIISHHRSNVISDGKFGAMMNVSLTNDGPVTLTLDSRRFEYVQSSDMKDKPAKPSTPARDGGVANQNESGDV